MRPKRSKDRLLTVRRSSPSASSSHSHTGTPAHLTRSGGRFDPGVTMDGSDDDSNIDNVSVFSYSSSRYEGREDVLTTPAAEDGEDGDDGYYDDFEDKLIEAMESATEKSTKGRILALESIGRAFRSRYMFDFVSDRFVPPVFSFMLRLHALHN